MNYSKLAKHLFNTNRELVKNTAIRDCHCLGLHSFIINEKPRIRLYIAEDDSELHRTGYASPIPIHAHKYDDMFQVINGSVIHYIYEQGDARDCKYKAYLYARVKEKDSTPILIGDKFLRQTDIIQKKSFVMPASTLHTVRLKGNNVMWMITELAQDLGFKQVGYVHEEHVLETRPELYKPFSDAISYVAQKLIML